MEETVRYTSDEMNFELPDLDVFGPQGVHVAALLERACHLTLDEARALAPVRVAARDAARDAALGGARGTALGAAREAAWDAARDAAWGAAWDAALGGARGGAWDAVWEATCAAWDAAWSAVALVVRDLITTEDYDTLTRPWREVIGPIHPDDPELHREHEETTA